MGASIRLVKILGVPISLHFSWFIIFGLFIVVFENHFGQREYSWSAEERWLASLATSLLLFLSVLAHELSHSLVAIRRGIPVKGITLFIFGGVSQIMREAPRPSTEFIVAVVGPLCSFILGSAFLGLGIWLEGISQHLSAIAWILGWANIGLGVFNMLPGFPLDGGRVLRSVIWQITRSYSQATRLATLGGQAIAFVMIALGIVSAILDDAHMAQGLWLVVLGVFLQVVASSSRRQSRLQENLHNYTARDVMTGESSCPAVPGDITLSRLMEDFVAPARPDFLVITREGRAQGVITRRLIEQVPRDQWQHCLASSVMVPLDRFRPDVLEAEGVVAVGPQEAAYNVIELMEGRRVKRVLVIEDGALLGTIDRDSMRRFARRRA